MTAGYEWDTEGRMTSMQYPVTWQLSNQWVSWPLGTLGYGYDANGRMNGLTWDYGFGSQPYAGATYGPAGEMLTLSYGAGTETRTYNNRLQLTSQVLPGYLNMTYNYSATQNNGRITSSVDGITGENTSYSYDALNRLTGVTNGQWSEQYGYDGFGNLTGKTGTGGAPSMTASYDAGNHQTAVNYDGNGNQASYNIWVLSNSYTVENRLKLEYWPTWPYPKSMYSYDPWGKRVLSETDPDPDNRTTGSDPVYAYSFYGITGQRLATVACVPQEYPYSPACTVTGQNVYFKGKQLVSGGVSVATDRLGSVRANTQGERFSYYPYGEERTTTVDGRDKFGTYFRDGVGQDYAEQRYYNSGAGRFWSVDPGGMTTAVAGDPGSWNRYAYVGGDPVNFGDQHGRLRNIVGSCDALLNGNPQDGCDGDGDDGSGGGMCTQDAWGFEANPLCSSYGDTTDDTSEPDPFKCPPKYQAWINAHGADAAATGLSEADVLTTSAIESGWGTGPFVKGNSFFNLETIWNPKTNKPAPKYAYQDSWMVAGEPFASGPYKGDYSLVASYKSAADSFKSFAATLGKYLNGVTDPATFASILVAHGINAGRASYFGSTAQTFQDCLSAQQ